MKIYKLVENRPQSFKRSLRILYLAFTVSILILTILSILFISQLNKVVQYSDAVDRTNGILYKLETLELVVKDAESNQRGYLLTNNRKMLEEYETRRKEVYPLIDTIYLLSDAGVKRKITELRTIINRRLDFLQSNLEKHLRGDAPDLAETLNLGKLAMEQVSEKMREIEKSQNELLVEGNVSKARYEGNAPLFFAIIIIVAGIINLASFFTILLELRRRKTYQQQLENTVMELRQHSEELEQFAFVASHDMQEPLRKIRTFSDRLFGKHRSTMDEEGQLIISRINDNSIQLHEIINEMIGFTNLARNHEELDEVNIADAVNDIREEYSNLPKEKQAFFELNNPGTIRGYPKQIELLLRALIDNSIKFSKPGEIANIIISGETINSRDLQNGSFLPGKRMYWRIRFEDNGIGFENEYSEKVFKLFQKLNNSPTANPGKGVGLALVNRIMVNHHGYASAESEPGDGVTVYLYFPIQN